MLSSMTATATRSGQHAGRSWSWEVRSVNGRGLDIRTRMPVGFERLETTMRTAFRKALSRGTVQVSLTLSAPDAATDALDAIPTDRIDAVLRALDRVQERAVATGVTLGQPSAADVLARLTAERSTAAPESGDLSAALTTAIGPLLSDLTQARIAEGRSLQRVMSVHLEEASACLTAIRAALPEQTRAARTALRDAYARILSEITAPDEARLAQELAMIAVRQDLTEEIDRLTQHVAAAWDALEADGPVGRRLDFLSQEMMREAGTLCAKAQNATISERGIALKLAIDRLREQAQNVE